MSPRVTQIRDPVSLRLPETFSACEPLLTTGHFTQRSHQHLQLILSKMYLIISSKIEPASSPHFPSFVDQSITNVVTVKTLPSSYQALSIPFPKHCTHPLCPFYCHCHYLSTGLQSSTEKNTASTPTTR